MKIHVGVRSVLPYGPMGGLERSARWHIDALRSRGHEVIVYAPMGGVLEPSGVDVPWPRLTGIPHSLGFAWSYLIWARRLARSIASNLRSGDVIHVHGASSAIAAIRPSLRKVPIVVNPHGMEEFGPLSAKTVFVRPLLKVMARSGAAHSSSVISTDRSITQLIVRNLAIPEARISLIPNVVDRDALFSLAEIGRSKLRTQFTFVTIGRLEENKGYDVLAKALINLDREAALPSDWSWAHFGVGTRRAEVEDALEAAGRRDRVHFHAESSDEDVQGALSTCVIFVQPSRYEGSSLTTLEAMAHGRTVVATSVGGLPDKIKEGVTGYLCEPNDAGSLAGALLRAFAGGTSATGRNAAEFVDKNYSEALAAESYLSLYSRLLSKAAK